MDAGGLSSAEVDVLRDEWIKDLGRPGVNSVSPDGPAPAFPRFAYQVEGLSTSHNLGMERASTVGFCADSGSNGPEQISGVSKSQKRWIVDITLLNGNEILSGW